MFADDVVCGSEARHMREVTQNPILWAIESIAGSFGDDIC